MAKKPQHRRHALDRLLQRGGDLDLRRAQHRADIDQIAQHRELDRRAARAVTAIGQDLHRQLAFDRAQRPRHALRRTAERDKPADQALQRAQPRRAGEFPGGGARRGGAPARRCSPASPGATAGRLRGRRSRRNARSRQRSASPRHRSARRSGATPRLSASQLCDQRPRRVARRAPTRSNRRASRTRATPRASPARLSPETTPASGCAPSPRQIRSRRPARRRRRLASPGQRSLSLSRRSAGTGPISVWR